ncbi:IucA/IucC family protein [Priestia koreensis]|uniref:IucA/IucC family protein n=2 Tax=Bacteria TaxID=2 RepID=UPI001F576A47|nr:IucA/IucC family siderophore biosynthesis protein [Priestia koreensis]UNL83506.1 IucA/IucC family siderophore biosynthesis protein [Priestia koreensis]
MKMFTNKAWNDVNQRLTEKMLQEFMYEDMIRATELEKEGEVYTFFWDDENGRTYQFKGKKRLFDRYTILPGTIKLTGEKVNNSLAITLLSSVHQSLGMNPTTTGHLIKEYLHTLTADMHLAANQKSNDELLHMSYEELEGEMTGHPWITYNKGRIGFSYEDYIKYAPEQKNEVKLHWIAVHKDIASFHAVPPLNHETVVKGELGINRYEQFQQLLKERSLISAEYYLMPVHEWQWKSMIVPLYIEAVANDQIVMLGEGEDYYLPQQSIRTFVNTSHKEKYHVKVPMSILNTLVYRGLPSERTIIAPEVTQFIKGIWEQDAFLREECRVGLLGEVATLNVDQPAFTHIRNVPYQYLEMLGVVFRESIYTQLEKGEKAITLAALLHRDVHNEPFVLRLIERSGLTTEEWIGALHHAVLPPLLHFLYQYGTVFSPHGQNTVLVLKDHKPVRIIMKDFVDDVNVSDQLLPELERLPQKLKHVLRSEAPEGLTQFILTGLFICHYCYLASMLAEEGFSEQSFWAKARQEILTYQNRFPHLEERFKLFDMLRPTFTKLCLNRNRMVDYGYNDDHDRPHASEYGVVQNALSDETLVQC